MRRNWRTIGLSLLIASLLMNCNRQEFTEILSETEQLELDIETMETYLSDNGYTEYDTLVSDVRVVILDEGDGEAIQYGDFVEYEYIGSFTSDLMFDSSLPGPLYTQDTTNAVSFELSELSLDYNGFPLVEAIEFQDNYFSVYDSTRRYEPFLTTHTQNGWFLFNESGSIAPGFLIAVNHALENTKIGSRVLALMPVNQAALLFGFGFPQEVVIFEIRPTRIRE